MYLPIIYSLYFICNTYNVILMTISDANKGLISSFFHSYSNHKINALSDTGQYLPIDLMHVKPKQKDSVWILNSRRICPNYRRKQSLSISHNCLLLLTVIVAKPHQFPWSVYCVYVEQVLLMDWNEKNNWWFMPRFKRKKITILTGLRKCWMTSFL